MDIKDKKESVKRRLLLINIRIGKQVYSYLHGSIVFDAYYDVDIFVQHYVLIWFSVSSEICKICLVLCSRYYSMRKDSKLDDSIIIVIVFLSLRLGNTSYYGGYYYDFYFLVDGMCTNWMVYCCILCGSTMKLYGYQTWYKFVSGSTHIWMSIKLLQLTLSNRLILNFVQIDFVIVEILYLDAIEKVLLLELEET